MSENGEPLLTQRERDALARNPEAEIVAPPTDLITKPDLIGVGGWLAFLAISLTFLGPFFTLATTAAELSMLEREYPGEVGSSEMKAAIFASWGITIAYCAISIFAGYRLFRHHVPSTVPLVICCMWIAGPVLDLVVIAMSDGETQAGASIPRSLIGVGIWTAYLLLSKRVMNTYRSPQPEASLTETFR